MPRIIAERSIYYAGKEHRSGETFEASETDAKILCGLGHARADEAQQAQPPASKPEPMPEVSAAPDNSEPAAKKRRYMRRDMRAED